MSKTAKSKLKWRYYKGEAQERYVLPEQFKRLHAPLEKDIEFHPDLQGYGVHLRPCAEGLDEHGEIAATLYCTRTGRFFDRDKKGFWNEHKPRYFPNRPSRKCGGHANYKDMYQFGRKGCHLLVAHAWVESRYNYMVEKWNEKKGKMEWVCTRQVDHIDGNCLNNNADNLQYVTPAENTRRATLMRRLRKAGFDPASCTTAALRIILNAMD